MRELENGVNANNTRNANNTTNHLCQRCELHGQS